MPDPSRSAQEQAESVLAQIEAAIRIAQAGDAPEPLMDELRAIHRRLHRDGLSQRLQGSFF